MVIVILSDVHGNQEALLAVLEHARRWQPAEYWCLGDVVGYGPLPYQVWLLLRTLDIPEGGWVAGNHEWGVLGRLPKYQAGQVNSQRVRMGHFDKEASVVIELQRSLLEEQAPETLDHFQKLPVVASPRRGVYLTHGRFMRQKLEDNVIFYSNDPGDAEWSWETLRDKPFPWAGHDDLQIASPESWETPERWAAPRLIVTGHTHVPMLWRRNKERGANGQWEKLALPHDDWLVLEDLDGHPVHLNPGSVGQPRDGSGLARYAVLNWESDRAPRIRFCELEYDHESTQEQMTGYPQKLIDLLEPSAAG